MSANLINENKYYAVLLKRDLYWISSWAFALKVFMFLLALLIQKPSKSSKAEEDNKKLVARLQTWKELNILDLLLPGQTVQERLKTSKRQSYKEYKIFSKDWCLREKSTQHWKCYQIAILECTQLTIDYLKNCHKNDLVHRKLIKLPYNQLI